MPGVDRGFAKASLYPQLLWDASGQGTGRACIQAGLKGL